MSHSSHHHHPHHNHSDTSMYYSPSHHQRHYTRDPRLPSMVSTSSLRHQTRVPTRQRYPVVVADPILAYNPRQPHASIEFDVSHPPSQILISHGRSRSSYSALSPHDLSQPATSPPLSYIRIRCDDLPWDIEVFPAAHSETDYVTIGDVVHDIYRTLRHRASGADWYACSAGMQNRVRDAWLRRCKRQPSHKDRAYESSNGLRRIDWLMKNRFFQGLSPGKSPDHWVMHVGQGEKYVKFWAGS